MRPTVRQDTPYGIALTAHDRPGTAEVVQNAARCARFSGEPQQRTTTRSGPGADDVCTAPDCSTTVRACPENYHRAAAGEGTRPAANCTMSPTTRLADSHSNPPGRPPSKPSVLIQRDKTPSPTESSSCRPCRSVLQQEPGELGHDVYVPAGPSALNRTASGERRAGELMPTPGCSRPDKARGGLGLGRWALGSDAGARLRLGGPGRRCGAGPLERAHRARQPAEKSVLGWKPRALAFCSHELGQTAKGGSRAARRRAWRPNARATDLDLGVGAWRGQYGCAGGMLRRLQQCSVTKAKRRYRVPRQRVYRRRPLAIDLIRAEYENNGENCQTLSLVREIDTFANERIQLVLYGAVARVNTGQIILSVLFIRRKDRNADAIRDALRRARYKFPGRQKIIVMSRTVDALSERPETK
ncbi:hypothetical protein CERSUDRAFT_71859 [Gelatoporia subvermispora B]|uniref:Uncharacterized protein n=1 Tax=Ceriporiopsis subvermispora (strain B) TaxID=914234 RepID=M2QSQ0_CERS8|nr:hypothetical protein CERSUDRAFT_71859 [Gelatoporia subvermispora B]